MHGTISHASKHPPDVNLGRSFTRPSATLTVIEGLGMRLYTLQLQYVARLSLVKSLRLVMWDHSVHVFLKHCMVYVARLSLVKSLRLHGVCSQTLTGEESQTGYSVRVLLKHCMVYRSSAVLLKHRVTMFTYAMFGDRSWRFHGSWQNCNVWIILW